jgi:hypothetical protein
LTIWCSISWIMEDSDPPKDVMSGGSTDASILLGGVDAMEVDEDLPLALEVNRAAASDSQKAESSAESLANPALYAGLIDRIIIPSPFPQHNAGPTSFRFRNALNRVLSAPKTDVEAWQALMTEVQTSFRSIQDNIHAVDAEILRQLDWVESCYGNLLLHFPYAPQYAVRMAQVLMAQSARMGEEGGPRQSYGRTEVPKRALDCDAKLERLLEHLLGFRTDGTPMEVSPEENQQTGTTNVAFGMCSWSVDLWIQYVHKVQRDANRGAASLPADQRAKAVREKSVKAFDLAVSQAGFAHDNHVIWKAYLEYVKSWRSTNGMNTGMATDHALAQQQMLQLRSVYKRLVFLPMTGLDQLWQEYEAFEKAQSEALASALIQDLQPKYQHARNIYLERNRVYSVSDLQLGQRLATPPPFDEDEDDYATKMEEDDKLLTKWKQRCSYERINPERLTSSDLNHRIRSIFKEMASTLTQHIEVWHMWSSWEILLAKPSTVTTEEIPTAVDSMLPGDGVLRLGQFHIPDSTLLAYAEAEILQKEAKHDSCLAVMEALLERTPTTLGFVLYQRMVRQRKGIDAARQVFGRARRALLTEEQYRQVLEKSKASTKEEEEVADGGAGKTAQDGTKKREPEAESRWMVTNRLDTSVGTPGSLNPDLQKTLSQPNTTDGNGATPSAGPVTWHLFASHAGIEHRINRQPDIAARVYELGLRKHASFLTKPAYVQRYAQLLAELGDMLNLRSLLTKAVAACEKQGNKEVLGALWDISLHYESVMTASDSAGMDRIQQIECQRRAALLGPDVEDVATGSYVGFGDTAMVGAQKSTIAEQLIRAEDYDTSSRIVNGLSRAVDVLGVMGVWGNATSNERRGKKSRSSEADLSGSRSDKSFQKRLDYHEMKVSGSSADTSGADLAGSRGMSARERLHQGSTAGSGPMTAMMLSIQQMPDWLRPLLLLLPASRLRIPVVAKPPPHLTELALMTLKQNDLPSERPAGDIAKKRRMGGGGDSSDEEGGATGSGYSNAFRARQRTRMLASDNTNGQA